MCIDEFGFCTNTQNKNNGMISRDFNVAQLTKRLENTKAVQNWTAVTEQSLIFLNAQERSIFFAVYVTIYIIAIIGNVSAIIVTIKRKHRNIQRTCIISLALSDLITATSISVMYLSVFSQPILVWTLGSFLCSFLPAVPLFGVVASSTILVGIALDRYRNVIHALKKRWNPDLKWCILGALLLWIGAAAIAYPMYTFFESMPIYVVYFDHTNTTPLYFEEAYMCITFLKNELTIYHICLMILVFTPLLIIFVWLYYKVAKLIWKHRKPLSSIFHKRMESSTTVETSTTQIRPSEECSRSTTNSDLQLKSVIKSKNARIERKIRTFKIIIFLMFTFLIMRLPNFFDTIKLTGKYTAHGVWLAKYTSISLVLLNCALNPFLYAFLNQTLTFISKFCKTLKDFTCKVCCCCCSNAEFEEFENENPFVREPFEKRNLNDSESSSMSRTKPKSSRGVKFENLPPVIQHYPPEPDTSNESYKEFKKY